MAIWQFNIYFIPKVSLLNKYRSIPEQLFIDHEGWENYFKNSDSDEKYNFEDAFTIFWWLDLNMSKDSFLLKINEIGITGKWIEKYPGNPGIAHYGDVESDDMSVCYDEIDKRVQELSCRIDLRSINKIFINKILLVAIKFNCLLMDRQGRLFEPKLNNLIEIIKKSNSYRFVSDPEQFLNDTSIGVVKPE